MNRLTLALPLLLLAASTIALGQNQTQNQTKTRPQPTDSATIVGSLNLTGQTERVPPTVLFTPTTNGLFRISIDMVITTHKTNNQQGYWAGKLQWTDVKPESRIGPYVDTRALGSHALGQTFTFSAVAGQAITFSTQKARAGNSIYDVFLVLEQLSEIPSF